MEKDYMTGPEAEVQMLIQEGPQKKKRKVAGALLSAGLICALGAGGIFAWFTDTDVKENKFTISSDLVGKIHVVEPGWDALPDTNGTDGAGNGIPDAAENMAPTESVTKDPAVSNEAEIPVWAFAQVKVPTANVKVLNEDGTSPETASMQELFKYELNDGWVEVFKNPAFDTSQPVSTENPYYLDTGTAQVVGSNTVHTYICTSQLGAATAGEGDTLVAAKTANIFDSVKLVNLVESQGTSGAASIIVAGHAIQAEGFATAYDGFNAYQLPFDGSESNVDTTA